MSFYHVILTKLLVTSSRAADIGVCYGRNGNNLPSPREVVALYKSQGINKMRIYDPNSEVLQALRGSNIELMLGVPNEDLESLTDKSVATRWVETNVLQYTPDVKITYVAVGNEVNKNPEYAKHVVSAMKNIFSSIEDLGIPGKVIVSTSIETSVIEDSYPPSKSKFKKDVLEFITPLFEFLSSTNAPILVSVYPYFAHATDLVGIGLNYALLNPNIGFTDPVSKLFYNNLFEAQLDSLSFAVDKMFGASPDSTREKNPGYVVNETGWSKAGRTNTTWMLDSDDESIDAACTYYQNVIRHVNKGTPRNPGKAIETYLFAMFDENLKSPEDEKHFGLFYPDQAPACRINFRE
ncbi:putative glucan endo-1 [Ranunculus cassubicifolius]